MTGAPPPGRGGRRQRRRSAGLTPLFDQVDDADLPTYFKPNIFGQGSETPASVERPPARPGLRIDRDSKGDPAQCRPDATAERIRFLPSFPVTMRWTNRPTFQQAVSYGGHR